MSEVVYRLATRGDDAGSCSSANRAIVEAARAGVLKNVSVMVPGPAFDEAVKLLKPLEGQIDIGVHLTLNAEWDRVKWGPVLGAAKTPSLVDASGMFLPSPMHFFEKKASLNEMLAEAEAQIDKARSAGLAVSYFDEHMGVGWLPGFRDKLFELLTRKGLRAAEKVKHLPGIKDGPADEVDNLAARLKAAPPGDYVLITHPGMDGEDMRIMGHGDMKPGQVARERDGDRRFLIDPHLPDALARAGARPVRFSELLGI